MTALVVVHRDGDEVVLDELQVFTPSPGEPVSPAAVERAVLDVAERFPRIEILADPWQLEGALERLKAAGVKIEKHTFSQGSVQKLSTSLYGAITSATLRVFPDAELEREILALRVVTTPSGWKFDHRAGGFSDRAVSLSMALQLAIERGAKPVVPFGVKFWHPPVRGSQVHAGGSDELLPGQKMTEREARIKNPGWRDPRYD